jgi:hypothetical protein
VRRGGSRPLALPSATTDRSSPAATSLTEQGAERTLSTGGFRSCHRLNCSGGLCVYIAEGLGLHRATG